MAELQPGAEIVYTVTFLGMDERPAYPRPHLPPGPPVALLNAEDPPPWYFLALYDAVGSSYEWTDWHDRPLAELEAFLLDPRVEMFTLMRTGWPAGFFVLDRRIEGVCDIAYFGLVPQMIGRGLGRWLIRTAVHTGWDRPGVARMTVNTNTLDHPAALALYQKAGFVPERRERHSRILTRPRKAPS